MSPVQSRMLRKINLPVGRCRTIRPAARTVGPTIDPGPCSDFHVRKSNPAAPISGSGTSTPESSRYFISAARARRSPIHCRSSKRPPHGSIPRAAICRILSRREASCMPPPSLPGWPFSGGSVMVRCASSQRVSLVHVSGRSRGRRANAPQTPGEPPHCSERHPMVNVSLEGLGDVAKRRSPSVAHRAASGRRTRAAVRTNERKSPSGTVVSVGRSIMRSCGLLLRSGRDGPERGWAVGSGFLVESI